MAKTPRLSFTLKVTDPLPVTQRRLREAMVNHINNAVDKAIISAKTKFPAIIRGAIQNSPEAQSLRGDILQAELGVTNDKVNQVLDYLADELVRTMKITFIKMPVFGTTVPKGSVELGIMPSDFVDNVISFTSASFLTDKGTVIPWLEWLLTLGNKIIVKRYEVDYQNVLNSRTGLATMSQTKVGGWRVPPQFSGTRTNNFITRALDDVSNYLTSVFENEIRRAI